MGWVCCWFFLLLREVFLWVLRFSLLLLNFNLIRNAWTFNTRASRSGDGGTTPHVHELKINWSDFIWMSWLGSKGQVIACVANNKQLLDEVEHDIMNYQNWGLCQRLRQITQIRGFDNSWYHAKTEFNNCFIIHFSHNSSSETEVKRPAILFLRRTLQGA